MGYTLYITNKRYSSWSMRPWVLLKALDIPFEEKLILMKPLPNQPHFLEFSPTGKVPCLYDGDEGNTVWESLALCEYIAEQYPAVWPKDRAARAFARSAASEMHAGFDTLRSVCPMHVAIRVELPTIDSALQKDLNRLTELFNQGLSKFGGPWLAGKEFTVADAFFAPVASRLKTYGLQLSGEAEAYITRVFEHPAIQLWIEQGIRETEREPHHEEGVTAGRKVLRDLSAELTQ